MAKKGIQYHCNNCGSKDVTFRVPMKWNVERQCLEPESDDWQWMAENVCNQCGHENVI